MIKANTGLHEGLDDVGPVGGGQPHGAPTEKIDSTERFIYYRKFAVNFETLCNISFRKCVGAQSLNPIRGRLFCTLFKAGG